jgi:hypothetical protein
MTDRRATAALGAALAVALLAACGGGGSIAAAGSSSSSSGPYTQGSYDDASSSDPASVARFSADSNVPASAGLPPRAFTELEQLYGPAVDAMGLKLTRAAVIRIQTGPHLQLYVEPTGTAISPQDYLARIVPLAQAIAPHSFADYPGIATFDICQEPPPGVDDSPEPPPVTVLFLTRAQVESVHWDSVTLRDLRRLVKDEAGGELTADANVSALSEWAATNPS